MAKIKTVDFKFGKSSLSTSYSELNCWNEEGYYQCWGVDETDRDSKSMNGKELRIKGNISVILPGKEGARGNLTTFRFNHDGYCNVKNDIITCDLAVPEKRWKELRER
jgi:hypothetical protein